jgi:phosphoenolpyruvate synthase/pyruvate phosphate dikinase
MQIVRDCETLDIGGKAVNLCRLREFCSVPAFFVIRLDSPDEIDDPKNQTKILAECERQGFDVMAVRSSASVEDSEEASFAGMFETQLGILPQDVLGAISSVLSASSAPRVVQYAQAFGVESGSVRMSVIVQQLVRSRVSGVCLTRVPVADALTIEACYGLGEPLVSGSVTPDRYVVRRESLDIVRIETGYQSRQTRCAPGNGIEVREIPFHLRSAQKLTVDEIACIAESSLQVEKHLGFTSADIEWAIAEVVLHILQARPLSSRLK